MFRLAQIFNARPKALFMQKQNSLLFWAECVWWHYFSVVFLLALFLHQASSSQALMFPICLGKSWENLREMRMIHNDFLSIQILQLPCNFQCNIQRHIGQNILQDIQGMSDAMSGATSDAASHSISDTTYNAMSDVPSIQHYVRCDDLHPQSYI